MRVEVIAATPDPVDVCSRAAGECYGKRDSSIKRLQRCLSRGHMSVFEHACATWRVEGISRACSHQLVRHRVASYSQQSQRYCRMDQGYEAVTPPSVVRDGRAADVYKALFRGAFEAYVGLLELGVPPEDARYVLPQGGETELVVTMNAREFMHFLDLRTAKEAQWEIRDLAHAMKDALKAQGGQWAQLVEMWEAAR